MASIPSTALAAQPLTFAHERTVPVHPVLAPVVGSGLVRGQTVMCTGPASMSCAIALLVAPTQRGSWVAVVGAPFFGVLAAADMGVVLDRTVFVDDPFRVGADPANVLGALVDGFDIVVTSADFVSSLAPSLVRRFTSRLQSRGAVCIVVDHTRLVSADLCVDTDVHSWNGIGDGHGRLCARRVSIGVDGRRHRHGRGDRPTRCDVWLPGPSGRLEEVHPASEESDTADVAENIVGDSAVRLRVVS
ncbi:MAG: hypothetical protein O3C62_07320 [Actinomycetota bacterium]|nr:hypothetical protein [Actinomycetota bacterium]MDA2971681.1 hypothetical protein [Actinomycetota bacterium]MDA3001475.1 hypothetical protein [Actinomycetota bacterium]